MRLIIPYQRYTKKIRKQRADQKTFLVQWYAFCSLNVSSVVTVREVTNLFWLPKDEERKHKQRQSSSSYAHPTRSPEFSNLYLYVGKKILPTFHDKFTIGSGLHFLLFVTYCFCFRRLGRPSSDSDSQTISRCNQNAEHDLFWLRYLRATNCGFRTDFPAATLIAITTRNRSWFLPGRSGNGTRAFLREKSLKSKRNLNPSNSHSTCQQSISFKPSLRQSVLRWPYIIPSYVFICYIRLSPCRHPTLGECSCDTCALNFPPKDTKFECAFYNSLSLCTCPTAHA